MIGEIYRHQDYVLGPNQDPRLRSIAPGQTIEGVALGLDTDAPFILRSRAIRNPQVDPGLASDLLIRFAGPNRDFRSARLIRHSLLTPILGLAGNPLPVYPQIVYPRGGVILCDIANDSAVPVGNVTLYFRGVKVFAAGAVRSYEYPAKFGALPFIYPQGLYLDSDGLTLVRNVLVVQGPLRQTFRVKSDADFVVRGGQAGDPFANDVNEVFIRLRDEDEKPYSNDGVQMDVLFGNARFSDAGPNIPGLFFPEIYVPKNQLLYFDISRNDSASPGAATVDIPISFIGQKVFAK